MEHDPEKITAWLTDQRAEIDVVQQCDRDLLQGLEKNIFAGGCGAFLSDDALDLLAAFRLAAEAKASGEAMERAAKIALAQIAEPGLSDNPAYVRFNPADLMARRIAAAIRAEAG